MAILKCKMCGGDLQIEEGMSVCECEYCGTRQTLPKVEDDQKLNSMNRANHFRRNCEFDRAMEAYEKLVQVYDDPEIYWSIALCKYGIEYVDDPATGKKIPTCHRMQYTSILDDTDFKNAYEKADSLQKEVYRQEAETIASIQRDILEISNKETPFDVFICYKESDDEGNRTQDSVLAQDIYYGLVEKGYKVFFSKITLESKLGTAYEPYIFAALNSAKVMIVVTTKPEYVNSVWVKNEWSRFIMLMQKDKSKCIIPAYRGMDPYDLPDALSVYQSQDMSKLGFMQDLIRGVSKVLEGSDNKESKDNSNDYSEANANITALLKRGTLALEDAEWDRAFDFFDQVLNIDAECAEAYVGQAFAGNKVSGIDSLKDQIIATVREPKDTTHNIPMSTEVIDRCNEILASADITTIDYPIEATIGLDYITHSESRLDQINYINDYFENDKLLKKAIRFSRQDGRIIQLRDEIIAQIQDWLKSDEELDLARETEAEAKMKAVEDNMVSRAQEAVEKKDREYLTVLEQYNTPEKTVGDLLDVQRQFKRFGNYKEAKKYVDEIDSQLEGKRKRLEELRDRRNRIFESFRNLGIFQKRQRQELEVELAKVNQEIDELAKDFGELA